MSSAYCELIKVFSNWKGLKITTFSQILLWINWNTFTIDITSETAFKIAGIAITLVVAVFTIHAQWLSAKVSKKLLNKKDI